MKLCFICSEYPPSPHGGIGTFTQVLARGLVASGHEVRVLGIYPFNHQSMEYEEDRGVRIWRQRAPRSRYGWPMARYQLWQQVAKWAKNAEIDLVEAPDWEGLTAWWPSLTAPVTIRLHGSVTYFQRELGKPVKTSIFKLEQAALRRADAWCSVSQYTAERTKAIFQLRSGPDAILYNPIEVQATSDRKLSSNHKVIFTGTLTYKKGIVSLIRAWPLVRQQCRSAELHVFGKDGRTDAGGSMREFLQEMLSSDSNCTFHGHVPRETLFDTFSTARVAVFPSYAEAFAVAPLESMTRGCPTIYSKRGSGPELIRDGVDGLLVDPDKPVEIAEAIIRVLQDDDLANRLSKSGRERVEGHFAIDQLTRANVDFYRQCIDRFHAKAA